MKRSHIFILLMIVIMKVFTSLNSQQPNPDSSKAPVPDTGINQPYANTEKQKPFRQDNTLTISDIKKW